MIAESYHLRLWGEIAEYVCSYLIDDIIKTLIPGRSLWSEIAEIMRS